MTNKLKIAVVEKNPGLVGRLRKMFADSRVTNVPSIDHVLEGFESEIHDILIITSAAFKAGQISGVELLEVIHAKSPRTQILFMVDRKDIKIAMKALKAGTYQYAKLPIPDEELKLLIETAIEQRPEYEARAQLKPGLKTTKLEQLVGSSAAMQDVYRQVRQAAATDMPVLLTGETGTGKDLTAQAIHNRSNRNEGSYIAVNLGALPTELVASELFGHEKGAFTGAVEQYRGKFELAHEGTVFLDEISTIDEKIQVSLLRLIEQKKFHRLGGRRAITSNARLITATNENLSRAIKQGIFREDLYYRLDVFRIDVPPLRERWGDIPLLIDEFTKRYNQSFNKNIMGIAPECITLLESYDWPGNIRELKNVIQRAVLVCQGDVILPEHLPPRFNPDKSKSGKVSFDIGSTLAEVEREMIVRTLNDTANNRKRTAEILGICRRALYNKMKKYGIA